MIQSRLQAAVRVLCLGLLPLVIAACGPGAQGEPPPLAPAEFSITGVSAFCMDQEAAGVRLEWSPSSGAATFEVLRDSETVATVTGSEHGFPDVGGLAPGSTVEYTVTARNAGGSSVTEPVSFQIPADLCPTDQAEIPAPPGSVDSLAAAAQCAPAPALQLSWQPVADAESLVLERDHLPLAELAGTDTSYLDDAVSTSGSYTYVLKAINEVGISVSLPLLAEVPFDICQGPVTLIAAHGASAMMIAGDGGLWVWGDNDDSSRLGLGHAGVLERPERVPGLPGLISVSLGSGHALALDSDGRVWAWGYGYDGELGLGRLTEQRTTPAEVPGLPPVSDVSAGSSHSLAVAADGTVWAWGYNSKGQLALPAGTSVVYSPYQVAGLADMIRVHSGRSTSFAIDSAGVLWAWGENGRGQLGLGDTEDRRQPEAVSLPAAAVDVATGDDFTLVRLADGTVSGFGRGAYLGAAGTTSDIPAPVAVPGLTGVADLAATDEHIVAVLQDGSVVAWGDNSRNQVGEMPEEFVPEPVAVGLLEDVIAVAAGSYHSLAVDSAGRVLAWGNNAYDQLGWNSPERRFGFEAVPLQVGIRQVAAFRHTLMLDTSGRIWSWGENYYGQLGTGDDVHRGFPQQSIALSSVRSVAAGQDHSLALDSDGTVWSWGYNYAGALGLGDTVSRQHPTQVTGLPSVSIIAAGTGHNLALDTNGEVWAWGYGRDGQLGHGSTTDSLVPVKVTLPGTAVAVSAGSNHSVVLLADGTVHSFGTRTAGLMGDGGASTGVQTTPVQTIVSGVRQVQAGSGFTAVLLSDGRVMTWGSNTAGQLGTGDYDDEASPVNATGLPEIVDIAVPAGGRSVRALAADGRLFGWGRNSRGELGFETPQQTPTPVELQLPVAGPVQLVTPAIYSSFAVVGGTLFASGDDYYGTLGLGRLIQTGTPRLIEDLPPAAVN